MKPHNKRLYALFTLLVTVYIFLFLSLKTLAGEGFRFVVMSDSHNTLGQGTVEAVVESISKLKPEFVLHCGDFTCCLGGSPPNRFKFSEYDLIHGIPVFPTTGNHEYDGTAIEDYKNFWKSRIPPVKISGEWAFTYSFDWKGLHFIAVEWDSKQKQWFFTDLAKNKEKRTIIFSHMATAKAGESGFKHMPSKLLNEAVKYPNVKAVFSGHSHCYWVGEIKSGTVQVLTGTVSHDNKRDPVFRGKRTFVVVDVSESSLKICPVVVGEGIISSHCSVVQ